MSVEQTEKIDAVTIDFAAGDCILKIVDHLEWNESHLLCLQEKINRYLRFVESGEVYVLHPAATSCDFKIEVTAIYAPDLRATEFLREVKRSVETAGFRWSLVPLGSVFADEG